LKYQNGVLTLYYKVLFMTESSQHLENLRDIKQMMQKSSRFISLSGLSGIAAGLCALAGAWVARNRIEAYKSDQSIEVIDIKGYSGSGRIKPLSLMNLEKELIIIAVVTFLLAFSLSFLFTYQRSKKTGVPIWGYVARKVMVNVMIPMLAGAVVIWKMMELDIYGLIAPTSLIFYGLALINASKYTFQEIRYLGYGQLILGLMNLWLIGYGLTFWAIGFGILHIIYGFVMWWKNERLAAESK